jgi:ferrochelatase
MSNSSKNLILLVNLGTPAKLTKTAIAKFLWCFLRDHRVVSLPKFLWYPILLGIILPFRGKRLLKQYKQIWHASGSSPLVHYTMLQAQNLTQELHHIASDFIVEYAFSYTSPDIETVLKKLHHKYNLNKLIVIPLYPQFSSTTTLSVWDGITRYYARQKYLPEIHFIHGFAARYLYINALTKSIRASWSEFGRAEHLVISYHSLPQKLIQSGDCYYEECQLTTRLLVEQLGLQDEEYSISFQSRFGFATWLTPATVEVVTKLAKRGVTKLDIICPGFMSDCLETLEEIAVINKNVFMANGGVEYKYIPCLNDSTECTTLLIDLVRNYL